MLKIELRNLIVPLISLCDKEIKEALKQIITQVSSGFAKDIEDF